MNVVITGACGGMGYAATKLLKEKGYSCSLVNARFVKPLDKALLNQLAENHNVFVTIEEGVITGGFGASVRDYADEAELDVKVSVHGINDQYVEHGNIDRLRKEIGLDAESIVSKIEKIRR